MGKLLREKSLHLKKGTIVDSTIIAAPSSTENQEQRRVPDAYQELAQVRTKKKEFLEQIERIVS